MNVPSWRTLASVCFTLALGSPDLGAPPQGASPTRAGGTALPGGADPTRAGGTALPEGADPTRAGGTALPQRVDPTRAGGATLPGGADPDAGKTVLYRDEFGVPHIYAGTVEQGIYAVACAQAEDRLEELLRNYLRATGEMSAAFGEAHLSDDTVARAWDHYGVARRNYHRIRPEMRRHLEVFARSINDYLAEHAAEVPAWWGQRKVDVYMQIAHSRQFMWGWPLGQAVSDLRATGLSPDFKVDLRSSNEWVVSPARTSVKAPILLIDPHLSWWGAQRFWEFRVHAGGWRGSGFTLPGSMYIGLGHNDHVAWAMTTGGPDTADVYELTLNATNQLQYRYDGRWKELKARVIELQVKGEERPRRITIYDSHHGPVIARKGDKAYAAKLSYADEVEFGETFYEFNLAKNIGDIKRGLALNQVMPQNVMAADTRGDIFYQRAGRVPIRPPGYDYYRPVDGSTSKSEWLGIHPSSDLYQVTNPPQGYMQNCNIPPDAMMIGSPMTADQKAPYLFGERSGWIHQRAARAVDILSRDDRVTPEEALAYALDKRCLGSERWVAALKQADQEFGQEYRSDHDYQAGLQSILAWNGSSEADSAAALKYYYWRQALNQLLREQAARELNARINDFMAVLHKGKGKADPLNEAQNKALVKALQSGMALMRQNHGGIDAVFGDVFRVGRDDQSWPVGGGSLNDEGMATLRAIHFARPQPDHTRWGGSGQTSTQLVILENPIRSWTQPPIGQSDHPGSPFYRDQAERLFSPGKMKPTWFAKEELLQHAHSRKELRPSL
ncbi:MAG: penicillin acylase family protein [Chloroflexi bacterium]|nr:penicillin acylase family protein [Chloroflexota bacterium]